MENMPEIEKIQQDIHEIKNSFTSLKAKLDLMFTYIKGNELDPDTGLIIDIKRYRKEVDSLHDRLSKIEKINNKTSLYISLLWTAAGALIMFILQRLFR